MAGNDRFADKLVLIRLPIGLRIGLVIWQFSSRRQVLWVLAAGSWPDSIDFRC